MKNIEKRVFLVISIGILLLFFICTIFNLDTSMKLYGVSNNMEFPKYNFEDIWYGKYQSDLDMYYKNNFPLRPYLVKLNNQMLYDIGANINDNIIVGKDGWLFTTEYVWSSYANISEDNKKLYAEYAHKIKLLEEKLEKADKELVYIITPSKVELYSEFLPNRYNLLRMDRPNLLNNYDYLAECLQKENVRFIDMTKFLSDFNSPYLYFSKTGIHWNYYAAAICAAEIVGRTDYCDRPQIMVQKSDVPMGTEQDVYLLSNIIKGIEDETYYSVSVDYPNIKDTERKNVLEMGTSFSGELAAAFRENGACIWNEYTRYQYFTNKYFYKGSVYVDESGNFNNNEEILPVVQEADIILIENNNSYIPESHFKFVDYLLNLPEDELMFKNCVDFDKEDLCVDFSDNGNSDEYAFTGFYNMENEGRWSMGEAKLSIPMETSKDIIIDLSENRFAEDSQIMFNDIIIWKTKDGTDKLKRIVIPQQLVLSGRNNYITVTTKTEILSPKDMGISEDNRMLAHWWGKLKIYTILEEEG